MLTPLVSTTIVISHISSFYYLYYYFCPPKPRSIFGLHRKRWCLVLVPIKLLLLLFTFHCTVSDHTTFLWQKVSFVADGYSVLAYVTASAHVSNDALDTTCIETVAQQGWYRAAPLCIRQYFDYLENIMSKVGSH